MKPSRQRIAHTWTVALLGGALSAGSACSSQHGPPPGPPAPPDQGAPRPAPAATPGAQSVTLKTRQVTAADAAVAPDGKWLVFSALGHLYRVSTKGGDARQLTFGPHYDSEPAVSPEGGRVAFVSTRGAGSVGSLFLLNLSTGQLSELANEPWVSAPAWSPDGKQLAYLSHHLDAPQSSRQPLDRGALRSRVRVLELASGALNTLTEAGTLHAVAYLNDGRLAWSELLTGNEGHQAKSQLVARDRTGALATQLFLDGVIQRIEPDRASQSVYLGVHSVPAPAFGHPAPQSVLRVELPGGEPVRVADLENAEPRPRFSVREGELWLGERGALWRVDTESKERSALPLAVEARLEVFPRATPRPELGAQAERAAILGPQPVMGGGLLYTAAGYLWLKPDASSAARRVFSGEGFEGGPAVASPDGRQVAYQHTEGPTQELRVADLNGGRSRTLVRADRTLGFAPAWHPSGGQLAYASLDEHGAPHVYLVDLLTGERRKLSASESRQPTPHFSADGQWLYFTALGQLQRVSLAGEQRPEAVTELRSGMDSARVSPDGKTLAFGRRGELWLAPVADGLIQDKTAKRFSATGGHDFAFTPDSSALVFAERGQVWRQPIRGGPRQVIAEQTLPRAEPRPLLIRNVRPLSLSLGRFLEPTSIFVDRGRIQWVGKEAAHKLDNGVPVLDGGGRFAIPGLSDLLGQLATPTPAAPAREVARLEGYVAYGVTSVADRAGVGPVLQAWADRRGAFGAPVPRSFRFPVPLETAAFLSDETRYSEEQVRQWARDARAQGATGLELTAILPWDARRALCDEALKQGLVVSGPAYRRQDAVGAAVLGYWSIAHAAPETWKDDLFQLLERTETHFIPMLSERWGNRLLFAKEPGLRQAPLLGTSASQSDLVLEDRWLESADARRETSKLAYETLLGNVKHANQSGVSLLPGSGALGPNCFYGQCLHTELWHLGKAGLAPIEVLRLATAQSAQALGLGEHLGTLEAGKLADIVLLDEDPLDDLRNTTSISHVVMEGRVFVEGRPYEPAAVEVTAQKPAAQRQ